MKTLTLFLVLSIFAYCVFASVLVGQWSIVAPSGEIPTAVSQHDCVVVGKNLYSYGGNAGVFSISNELQTLNLDSNEWSKYSPSYESETGLIQPQGVALHSMVSIGSKIYIIGGRIGMWKQTSDVLEYDTNRQTMQKLNVKPDPDHGLLPPRYGASAVAISDSAILVYGGRDHRTTFSDLWILRRDGENIAWAKVETKDQVKAVEGHQMVVVGNKVYSIGGNYRDSMDIEVQYLEIDSIEGNSTHQPAQWKPLLSANGKKIFVKRSYHKAITIHDTKIYIIGGISSSGYIPDVLVLDTANGALEKLRIFGSTTLSKRSQHCVGVYRDTIVVFGGTSWFSRYNDVMKLELKLVDQVPTETRTRKPIQAHHTAKEENHGATMNKVLEEIASFQQESSTKISSSHNLNDEQMLTDISAIIQDKTLVKDLESRIGMWKQITNTWIAYGNAQTRYKLLSQKKPSSISIGDLDKMKTTCEQIGSSLKSIVDNAQLQDESIQSRKKELMSIQGEKVTAAAGLEKAKQILLETQKNKNFREIELRKLENEKQILSKEIENWQKIDNDRNKNVFSYDEEEKQLQTANSIVILDLEDKKSQETALQQQINQIEKELKATEAIESMLDSGEKYLDEASRMIKKNQESKKEIQEKLRRTFEQIPHFGSISMGDVKMEDDMVDGLRKATIEYRVKLTNLKKQREMERSELLDKYNKLQDSRKELETKIQTAEEKIESVRRAKKKFQEDISRSSPKIEKVENDLAKTNRDIKSHMAELEELQKKIGEAQGQKEKEQLRLESIDQRLKNLEDHLKENRDKFHIILRNFEEQRDKFWECKKDFQSANQVAKKTIQFEASYFEDLGQCRSDLKNFGEKLKHLLEKAKEDCSKWNAPTQAE